MRKKYSIGILSILVLSSIFILFQYQQSKARHPREGGDPGLQEPQKNTSIQNKEEKQIDSRLRGDNVSEISPEHVISKSTNGESQKQNSELIILDKKVSLEFEEGETVYDVMQRLQEEHKISFTGKEYSTLGFFVTSIDSLSPGGGKNLMYYINGEEASVGISTYKIKEGDIIEWKLK